nr:hypothetical protein [Tanacetum cinerariifolium]
MSFDLVSRRLLGFALVNILIFSSCFVKGIVEALEELHSNRAFHRNFAPEHVLLKVSGSDVVVKLCGLGSSILTKKPFILDNYLAKEKLRRGKTLWNLFSSGKYKFKEDEIPSNFESGPIFNPNHEGL